MGVGVFDERVGVGLGEEWVGSGEALVAVGLGVEGSAGLELPAINHQAPKPRATTRTPMTTRRTVRPAPPPGGCGGCTYPGCPYGCWYPGCVYGC